MANLQSGGNAKRQMTVSRLFHAPVELLWEMWTRPEHIKEWWGPNGFRSTISRMEVKEGGEWEFVMHGPNGKDYPNKHIFHIVRPYKKLVMEHVPAPHFTMEVTFEKQGEGTLLTITNTFESEEELQEVIRRVKADEGLKQNVERLAGYMADEPFVIERVFNAPVKQVWAAITDAEEMKKWYFNIPGFKPEPGYEFQFTGGPDNGPHYVHLCKVIEVIAFRKLVHSWRYQGHPGDSFVTWELFEEGSKTRVRLTHSGLAGFGESNPDFARKNFAAGWSDIVGRMLAEYLSAAAQG